MFDNNIYLDTAQDNYKTSSSELTKEHLFESVGTEEIYEGIAVKCDSSGHLKVKLNNGIIGTITRDDFSCFVSENGRPHLNAIRKKVGKKLKFHIKKFNGNTLYLTRLKITEKIRELYNENLEEGLVVSAVVIDIIEKGALVDLGGDLVGIIPRHKIEKIFVNDISDHLEIGEMVKAKICDIKKDENGNIVKIALDRACLIPDFSDLAVNLDVNDVVVGEAKKIGRNGVYVLIDKHIVCVCNFPKKNLNLPTTVSVMITKINATEGRCYGEIVSIL